MDEATKYLVGQGILGVLCLALAFAVWRLWHDNKSLTDRLVAKAETDAALNRKAAEAMTEAWQSAVRTSEKQAEERQRIAEAAERLVQQPQRRRSPTVARKVDDE